MINGVSDEKSTFPKNICKHLWDRRLATHVDKNEMFRCADVSDSEGPEHRQNEKFYKTHNDFISFWKIFFSALFL